MKFLVTKVSYRVQKGRLLVDVYGRGENGDRVHKILTGTRPYFYAKTKPTKQSQLITEVTSEGVDIFGNHLWKIYTRYPSDVPIIREWWPSNEHYEANIYYEQRIRIDYDCYGVIEVPDKKMISLHDIVKVDAVDVKPRYAIADIEVDAKAADPKNPIYEVVSITIYDSVIKAYLTIIVGSVDKPRAMQIMNETLLKMVKGDQEKYEKYRFKGQWNIIPVKTEEELFAKLSNYMLKYEPDIFTGWYFVDFDWEYLMKRAEHEKYPSPDFRSREAFDLLPGYSRIHEGENRSSLEWCANEDFGFGKLKYEGTLQDLYRSDRDRFAAYNMWDVYLCELLNAKRNILGFHVMLSNVSSCPLHKTVNNSWIIDAYMLKFVYEQYVLPTNPLSTTGNVDKGAYVHEPSNGIFENVLLFDLKSEYPSLIISSNLSPETRWNGSEPPKDTENYYKTPRGNYYDKRRVGILPRMIRELIETRNAIIKKRDSYLHKSPEWEMYNDMQRSFKEMTNSAYGVMAYKGFRMRDAEVGSDITAYARKNVEWIIDQVRKMGYKDLYADTDSVFVQAKGKTIEERKEEGYRIIDLINKSFVEFGDQYGLKELRILLQFKMIYSLWVQVAEEVEEKGVKKLKGAKRYIGLIDWYEGKDIRDEPLDKRKEVKGFEVKRVNVAPYAKKIQHKVFDMILTRIPPEEIGKFIRGVHQAIKLGKIAPEMLAIPASVGQESYSPVPAFIRSVYYTKDVLGIDMTPVGSDFIWCYGYMKDKPLVHCKGVDDCAVAMPSGDKFPDDFIMNTDRMIERNLIGPLDSIVRGIGLGDIRDLLSPTKSRSLEAFA